MTGLTKTIALLSVLALVACGEATGPSSLLEDAGFAKGGRWASDDSSVTEPDPGDAPSDSPLPANTVVQSADAPPLLTYSTSFMAVQGQTKMFNVYYQDPRTGGIGDRFLYVEIPWDAQLLRPDGTPAANGDAIEITVEIDPVSFFVQFGPHGSTFLGNTGAQLWFNYVNAESTGDNRATPTIWYQPTAGEAWEDQGTRVERRGKWVFVEIDHFSNYALAW